MNKDKLLKILILVLIIIFFVLGCFTIYKFIIINKVLKKMGEYIAIENYHMEIKSEEENSTLQVFYKDGIGKNSITPNMYTWTDGNEAYLVDEENKQIQKVDMNDSAILISNEFVASMLPGYSKTNFQKFVMAGNLSTSVKLKNYDGVKYYIITTIDEKEKVTTVWLKYDSLLPSQISIKIGDYKKTFNYDITFDKVRDEEVKKPNIEDYELIDSE